LLEPTAQGAALGSVGASAMVVGVGGISAHVDDGAAVTVTVLGAAVGMLGVGLADGSDRLES
jgi:hypothetical protein